MSVKERLHTLIEELPESDLLALERVGRGLKLPPGLNGPALSEEQRQARITAVRGKYAGSLSAVDEFLARKHRDTEREEERMEGRRAG